MAREARIDGGGVAPRNAALAAMSTGLVLMGCSIDFHPAPCATNDECGSGMVCSGAEGAKTCVDAAIAPIRVGMSAPASGPSQELGTEMKRGIDLAFVAQNQAGGLFGREVQLEFRDDEYRPEIAEVNARGLLAVRPNESSPLCPTTAKAPVDGQKGFSDTRLERGEGAVVAILGNVGTPTMVRFAPVAVETQTLFFGAFTGADVMLRDGKAGPCSRYIFNVRASYGNEAQATLSFFVARGVKDWRHLMSFDQNDSFGQAGYDGLTAAYAASEELPVIPDGGGIARFRYTRDDVNSVPAQVSAAISYITAILAQDQLPHTFGIMMTDTYGPGTEFITSLREWQYADPDRAARVSILFSNVSFVGPNALAERLVDAGTVDTPNGPKPFTDGVFVSQVVPNYYEDASEAVQEYKRMMSETGANPSFTSLEGYIAARVFLAGLGGHDGSFSTESMIAALENMPELSLGLGATAGFTSTDHNYSKSVWGTAIAPDGTFRSVYYWREGAPISFFE